MHLESWMFCLWVSHPGYWSSWGAMPPEVTPPWILCLLISSGITLLVVETWMPVGKMPLGTAPLGAMPAGTTLLGALSLGIMLVMVSGRAYSNT